MSIEKLLPFGLIAGAVLLAKPLTDFMTGNQTSNSPRGIRNNNPGNIRRTETTWLGERTDVTDTAFEEFTTPEYGIRAMFVLLNTYRNVHGLATLREVISRWAPPSENNTDTYVNFVAEHSGIDPDTALSTDDHTPIVQAIVHMENGVNPYSDTQYSLAQRMV